MPAGFVLLSPLALASALPQPWTWAEISAELQQQPAGRSPPSRKPSYHSPSTLGTAWLSDLAQGWWKSCVWVSSHFYWYREPKFHFSSNVSVTESNETTQNHRISQLGRDPRGTLSPASSSTQDHPKSNPMSEHCQNAPWTPAPGAVPTALGSLFHAHCPLAPTPQLHLPWHSPVLFCRLPWGLPSSSPALRWTNQGTSAAFHASSPSDPSVSSLPPLDTL